MNNINWSKDNHKRFGVNDKQIVITLLLIQKYTQFTLKDILIYEILPRLLVIDIPVIYISNIELNITEDELVDFFTNFFSGYNKKFRLEKCKIAKRSNGRSKGFGFIKCMNDDDSKEILKIKTFEYKDREMYCREAVGETNFYFNR